MIMKSKLSPLLFSGIALLFLFNPSSAATLNSSNGELLGAFNVLVDGKYYNVEFKDGTAEDLFKSNDAWNFTFTTVEEAKSASQALYDQVFIQDNGYKIYDDNPELTIGVESLLMGVISTPYELDVNGLNVANWAMVNYGITAGSEDLVPALGPYYSGIDIDYGDSLSYTYAKWHEAVPVPTTFILFLTGLLYITNMNRKKTGNKYTNQENFS